MKIFRFEISGYLSLPDETTQDGLRLILPDGTTLSPIPYFEQHTDEDDSGDDRSETWVCEKYQTDIQYTREVWDY